MGAYYFIKSKLNGNVIDIQKSAKTSGALLDAYPKKKTGTDNQLWEFVPDPAGSGCYFIKSKLDGHVIDVQHDSFTSGAPLDAFRRKPAGAVGQTDNQLWQFVQDPKGSGYCFIMSKLNGNVIDIRKDSSKSGAQLDAFPMKAAGTDNQLWTVEGGAFPSTVPTVAPPGAGLKSNSNYILFSNCKPVINGAVIIDITEDLACDPSAVGFSFQLNCYSPKHLACAYQQFVMGPVGSQMVYNVNTWPVTGPALINLGTPNLVGLPNPNVIPAGYRLIIGWGHDLTSAGYDPKVTRAFFEVIDNLGNTLADATETIASISGATSGDLAPVVAFELNLVGPYSSESVKLTSGAGTIIYVADQPVLSVLNSEPSCTETKAVTAETANSVYGLLPANPNSIFKQTFNIH